MPNLVNLMRRRGWGKGNLMTEIRGDHIPVAVRGGVEGGVVHQGGDGVARKRDQDGRDDNAPLKQVGMIADLR